MKISNDMRTIAHMASRNEKRDTGLYKALCIVLGRMDRDVNGKYDEADPDPDYVAFTRGMTRIGTILAAPKITTAVAVATAVAAATHSPSDC